MSNRQPSLFDALDHLPATDPNVAESATKRLSGQNRKILDMLNAGPVRLRELIQVASKYTSRISDLRKAGCVIECQEQPDGNSIYLLKYKPASL
jgi:hypothetical protein